MKKQIAVAMGLAVLSTGALASKARLQALGEDTFGSFFIDDTRNVLLNPAHLNSHKDFVTMEFGNNTDNTSTDQDSASRPKSEGGVFKSAGNLVYGLYFGDESNTANNLRYLAMGANKISEDNVTTLYVAGDAGVQWGVKLSYLDYKDKQNSADKSSNGTLESH